MINSAVHFQLFLLFAATILLSLAGPAAAVELEDCSLEEAERIAGESGFAVAAGNWNSAAFPLSVLSSGRIAEFSSAGHPMLAALDPVSGLLRTFHRPDWLPEGARTRFTERDGRRLLQLGGELIDFAANRRHSTAGAPTRSRIGMFPALLTVAPAVVEAKSLKNWHRPQILCPVSSRPGGMNGAEPESLLVQTAEAEAEFSHAELRAQGVVTREEGGERILAARWPATGRLAGFGSFPEGRDFELDSDGLTDNEGVEYDFFGRGLGVDGGQVQLQPAQLGLYLEVSSSDESSSED